MFVSRLEAVKMLTLYGLARVSVDEFQLDFILRTASVLFIPDIEEILKPMKGL